LTEKTVPLKAILALVQYLEVDEGKHFERMSYAGEDTSNHVFNNIRIVSDWLDQQPRIPNAAERERRRLAPIDEAFAKQGVATGDFADLWEWWKRQFSLRLPPTVTPP
jgi:hypothetical protein